MTAYYNENDDYAANWLENLIAEGLIANGTVDRRSIADVRGADLSGFTQCHFFAGAGGWSLALRLAGWADSVPAWTGSCPCQPWSQAGQRRGFSDKRHLWPEWFRLIGECEPPTIFGEQVANAGAWLDAVFSDLEGMGYACGAADLPAACAGAPQARPRLWFVADAASRRRQGWPRLREDGALGHGHKFADCAWWNAEPGVARVADGIPGAVDQRRVFGNAIVPQVAARFVSAFMGVTN